MDYNYYCKESDFRRTDIVVKDTHQEMSNFSNNEILSSSEWSSVIHQPSQDSEPEDLPSTVDINAIKDSPTPHNSSNSTFIINDENIIESENDSDSNRDNEEDSVSGSDSDSVSSDVSSVGSQKSISSSSDSFISVKKTSLDGQKFSVQENNFDQGGLKLKLSALKNNPRKNDKRLSDSESLDETLVKKCFKRQSYVDNADLLKSNAADIKITHQKKRNSDTNFSSSKKKNCNKPKYVSGKSPEKCNLSEDSIDIESVTSKFEFQKKNKAFRISPPSYSTNLNINADNSDEEKSLLSTKRISESSSDSEMVSNDLVRNAIESIHLDSDSDYKSKCPPTQCISENSPRSALSNIDVKVNDDLKVFNITTQKLEELHKTCVVENKGLAKKISKVEDETTVSSIPIITPSDITISSLSGQKSHESPDSGIQSESPCYQAKNSPLPASCTKVDYLNQTKKQILTTCDKKDVAVSSESKSMNHNEHSNDGILRSEHSSAKPTNKKKVISVDNDTNADVLKVPPYIANKSATNSIVNHLNSDVDSTKKIAKKSSKTNKLNLKDTLKIATNKSSSKYTAPVIICVQSSENSKKKKYSNFDFPKVINFNGTLVPVIKAEEDWFRKPKKNRKKKVRQCSLSFQSKDVDNLVDNFKQKCVIGSTTSADASSVPSIRRVKPLNKYRERSKKRKYSEIESEIKNGGNLTSITHIVHDIKPKRRHKKIISESPKIHDSNDQRLPLKKRPHYHISDSLTNSSTEPLSNENKKRSITKDTSTQEEVNLEFAESSSATSPKDSTKTITKYEMKNYKNEENTAETSKIPVKVEKISTNEHVQKLSSNGSSSVYPTHKKFKLNDSTTNVRRSNRSKIDAQSKKQTPPSTTSESHPVVNVDHEIRNAKKSAIKNIMKSSNRKHISKINIVENSKSNDTLVGRNTNVEAMKNSINSKMAELSPPVLSSIHKEKTRKSTKINNEDISDCPPTLDVYETNTVSKNKSLNNFSSLATTSSNICHSPYKAQLITPLPSEPLSRAVSPGPNPPAGVFEPSNKLSPTMEKSKKSTSIDDVLIKLKKNWPTSGTLLLNENLTLSAVKTDLVDKNIEERAPRPKRLCTEKEIGTTTKPAGSDNIPALTRKRKMESIVRTEKNNTDIMTSKRKTKRAKRNMTGFPAVKRKKTKKSSIPITQNLVISIPNLDMKDDDQCASTPDQPQLLKQESNENCYSTLKSDDNESMISETPPILTAISELESPKSNLENVKIIQNTESSSTALRSHPNRYSSRLSALKIEEQMKKEAKKNANKEEIIEVDGNQCGKCNEHYSLTKENSTSKNKGSNLENVPLHDTTEDDINELSKKDYLRKGKNRYLKAGLFSDYYKQNKLNNVEKSRVIPFKSEDHPYGLLPPPPYFDHWVRGRTVDFKLPFDIWWSDKRNEHCRKEFIDSMKYKELKTNVYHCDVKRVTHSYEAQTCNCTLSGDNPEAMGCNEDCLNRAVYAECSPDLCPLKDRCSNQRIQKHDNNNMELVRFMTKDKGIGLKTKKCIKAGEYIVQYLGEVVSEKEFRRRMMCEYKDDVHHCCLGLDGNLVIDAHRMGSDGRFVNHSCEPNCEMQKWNINGLFTMALFAKRDIEEGEELTYDYNFSLFNRDGAQPCHCGSIECRGVIGEKSKGVTTIDMNIGSINNVNVIAASNNLSNISKKSRLRPRKQLRQESINEKHIIVDNDRIQSNYPTKKCESVSKRTPLSLPLVDEITHDERNLIRKCRPFMYRNLMKVYRVREKLKIRFENKKLKQEKSKLPIHFPQLLNAFTNEPSIKTRGIVQAGDDPELTKALKLANVFRNIFNEIIVAKDERDEHPFSSLLKRLPTKIKEKRIENPIDLNGIEKNILNGVYTDVLSFDREVYRLFSNAIKLFTRTSEHGIAAARLHRVYDAVKIKFIPQIEEIIGTTIPVTFIPSADEEDVIRCICGLYQDEGLMISCDRCYVWQHCDCVGANPEAENYLCEKCSPREVDYEIVLRLDDDDEDSKNKTCHRSLMRGDLQIRLTDTVYVLRDIPNPETGQRHTYDTMKKFKYEDCDIFYVEQLWKTTAGERFAYGHHYVRPHETYHEVTRKFYPNEVLKISEYEIVPLDLIMGRCHVLDLKTYCKGRPVDSDPNHLYICEYRYICAYEDMKTKSESFKKSTFKKLPKSKLNRVCTKSFAFITYDTPLRPSRNYAPHGIIKSTKGGSIASISNQNQKGRKIKDILDSSSECGSLKSVDNGCLKLDDDDSSVSKKDSMVYNQRCHLNKILLKLLAKMPTKSALDVTYLLDTGRRYRKKQTAMTNGNVT